MIFFALQPKKGIYFPLFGMYKGLGSIYSPHLGSLPAGVGPSRIKKCCNLINAIFIGIMIMTKRSPSRRNGTSQATALKQEEAVEPVRMISSSELHGWMLHDFTAEPAINDHELTSITALITYVAYTTKQNEFFIERQFADRFNIPNVKCLPIDRYDDAIRYLVDQVPATAAANV